MEEFKETEQSKLNVLIVEDEPFTRRIIEQCFLPEYNVLAVADAESALEALKNNHISLVISDIGLPGKSGLDLREVLLSQGETAVIPFIFLTANTNLGVEERAYSLGIDDYLVKPVERAKLKRATSRVLARVQKLASTMGNELDRRASLSLSCVLPDNIRGLRVALWHSPAQAGGGDFVLHVPRPVGDLVIIADVMGKGFQAKYFAHLYAAYIQGLIRSLPQDLDPSGVLTRLNDLIRDDANLRGHYTTCQVFDIREDGKVSVASAGHPLPVMVQGSSHFPLSMKQGPLPGFSADSGYETHQVELGEGARLVACSDGLFEGSQDVSRNENYHQELYGLMTEASGVVASTLLKDIQSLFHRYFEVQHDDITCLILEKAA